MDKKIANDILMMMGGERCRKSHLLKRFSMEEIENAIMDGYIVEKEIGNETMIIKTQKGKKLW